MAHITIEVKGAPQISLVSWPGVGQGQGRAFGLPRVRCHLPAPWRAARGGDVHCDGTL